MKIKILHSRVVQECLTLISPATFTLTGPGMPTLTGVTLDSPRNIVLPRIPHNLDLYNNIKGKGIP